MYDLKHQLKKAFFILLISASCAPLPTLKNEFAIKLQQRMSGIANHLSSHGYTILKVVQTHHLEQSKYFKTKLQLNEPMRVVLIAIPQNPTQNLDIHASFDISEVTTSNTASDNRAAVEIVVKKPDTLKIAVHNTGQAGPFMLAVFRAKLTNDSIDLSRVFDYDLQDVTPWKWIHHFLKTKGYHAYEPPKSQRAVRNNPISIPISLQPEQCYVFVARGTAGIDSISMGLTYNRSLIAQDTMKRRLAWIDYCAPSKMLSQLLIRVNGGSGTITIGKYTALHQHVSQYKGPLVTSSLGNSTIAQKAKSITTLLQRRGYRPEKQIFKKSLNPGNRRIIPLPKHLHSCGVATAVTTNNSTLSLELWENDQRISHSGKPTDVVHLPFCQNDTQTRQLNVIMLTGTSMVSVQFNGLEIDNLNRILPNSPFSIKEAWALFRQRGLKPIWLNTTLLQTTNPTVFQKEVKLKAHHCYAMAAVSSHGKIDKLEIKGTKSLWRGPAQKAILSICPQNTKKYTIQATASTPSSNPQLAFTLFSYQTNKRNFEQTSDSSQTSQ